MALLMKDRNIDILCISETWLLPNVPDNFAGIMNYKFFSLTVDVVAVYVSVFAIFCQLTR